MIMMNDREYMKEINSRIKEMHTMIETISDIALQALKDDKVGVSKEICQWSYKVRDKEDEVTAGCVEALIRYQPFASDLRAVTVALKVSYYLTRVSRYLYNVTQIIDDLNTKGCESEEISSMLEEALDMVRQSLEAYFNRDALIAAAVLKRDAGIDSRYRQVLEKYKGVKCATGECILFNGLIARVVERMADHACYISNETIYLATGKRAGNRIPECDTH